MNIPVHRTRRRTCRATRGPVDQEPILPGGAVLSSKTLRKVSLATIVGLVRRVATEHLQRNPGIVVVEVGCYQLLQCRERIELMQIQPAMAKLVPQALYQGIGLRDVDLSHHALRRLADVGIRTDNGVLGTAVGQDVDRRAGNASHRFFENQARTLRRKRWLQCPGKHTSGEAVYHAVQIAPGPVEQLDDGYIEMEPFIGLRRPEADFGLARVQTASGPAPAVQAHHARPSSIASESPSSALRVQRQRAQGEVLEVVCLDHVSHCSKFSSSEAARPCARARWGVVEHAQRLPTLPGAKPAFAKTDDLESREPTDDPLRAGYSSEDRDLPLRRRDPRSFQRESIHSGTHDQKAYERRKDCDTLLELADSGSQFDEVRVGLVERDDIVDPAVQPCSACRLGYRQLGKQVGVSRFDDCLPQAMIVGIAADTVHRDL